MDRLRYALLAASVLLPCSGAQTAVPPDLTVGQRLAQDLQWTQEERESRFGHMDRIFPVNRIHRGTRIAPLPQGAPLSLAIGAETLPQLMQRDRLAGVLVLQNGRVRLEQYALGADRATH